MNQKIYVCENCGKEFTEDYRKTKRFSEENPPRFCCKECAYQVRGRKTSLASVRKSSMKRELEESQYCQYCGRECKNLNSLRNHERLCKNNPNRQHIEEWTHNEKWKKSNRTPINSKEFIKGEFKCRYCGRISPYGHSCHLHEKYCKENPNRIAGKSHVVSPEVRKKISQTQKENFKDGHSRYPFTRAEDSYPEKYFIKWLNGFTTYKHNYHVDRYFLDFAWPESKTYIEVNGSQHYETEEAIQHDEERFKILESLGWKCLSIVKWSSYKALPKKEQKEFLKELKNKIEGNIGGLI